MMATLYMTARNHARISRGLWIYSGFHLGPLCGQAAHVRPLIPVALLNLELGASAWKSRVRLGCHPVGYLCARCYADLIRKQRARAAQQALAGAT